MEVISVEESQQQSSAKRKKMDNEAESDSSNSRNVQMSNYALKVAEKQYLDAATADVYFQCGPERERIAAHKSVLSRAKLREEYHKSKEEEAEVEKGERNAEELEKFNETDIKLPSTSPEAMKDFLQFCYKGKVNLKMENITEVMGLLDEYQMFECLEVCGKYMEQHLTIEDICWAYNWSIHYNIDSLKQFCERKISACPETVFKTKGFLTCEYNILERIVKLESLTCFEISILEACLDWSRNACERNGSDAAQTKNIRSYLKNSLYEIRYGSIDGKDFIKFINKYPRLFTDPEDYEEIFRLTCGQKDLKTDRFKLLLRSANIFPWEPTKVLDCNLRGSSQHTQNLFSSGISTVFTSNQPLLLGGFK
ncbi:BTB/POZ domain-containing protein 3-like, partial [Sitodiplosis mosellana]|uniref:BTB/POZ domain-containing protein 3-like n=1 Tax=Sitodiplosis mosellana TaxID=263140 RepID=UPI002444EA17